MNPPPPQWFYRAEYAGRRDNNNIYALNTICIMYVHDDFRPDYLCTGLFGGDSVFGGTIYIYTYTNAVA